MRQPAQIPSPSVLITQVEQTDTTCTKTLDIHLDNQTK